MNSEESIAKETSTKDFTEFSNYGNYTVTNELTLRLPNTKITFQRLSEDKYSYTRENLQSGLTESLISVRTKNLEIDFVPSFPIHVPAHRTDYVFLKFIKPIFISMKSSTEIYVPVPIENAIFFTGSHIHEHIDVFSCIPNKSRFGLYGPPENGKLAKTVTVEVGHQNIDFEPFLYAKMKVMVENDLKTGFRLGRIVFPVTNHDIYYRNDRAAFDTLKVMLKDRLGVDYPDIECEQAVFHDWHLAPRHMEKTKHEFSMKWDLANDL